MVILDSNVISETAKSTVNQDVVEWLDNQVHGTLCTTAITVSEIFFGLEILPGGKRKKSLSTALTEWISYHIGERVLSFDQAAAREYVSAALHARKRGLAVSFADGQIASIARLHGLPVATRDESAFQSIGVTVINPFRPGTKHAAALTLPS